MPMNLDAVGSTSEPVTRSWTSTDCLLYALGVGAGALDPTGYELEYTTENSAEVEQQVLPTFATIVGLGGAGRSSLGDFDPAMLVHGEQSIEMHGAIPPDGAVTTTSTVAGIFDKGSGALVVLESRFGRRRHRRAPCFSSRSALFIRGEGGFGGDRGPASSSAAGARGRGRRGRQLHHADRPGPSVPVVGRPQSPALGPGLRQAGRLRPAHPPRPVHLRIHRPGPAPHPVRLRSDALPVHARPLLPAHLPGRHPDRLHVGGRPARPPSAPRTSGARRSSTGADSCSD